MSVVHHSNKSTGCEHSSESILALAARVQNISREPESRDLLLASANAIRFLSDLLFASVAQCQAMHSFDGDGPLSLMHKTFWQVCAVGALMNLLGPTFVDESNPMATTPNVSEYSAIHTVVVWALDRQMSVCQREAFKAMLSDCVAFGSIYSCLFD